VRLRRHSYAGAIDDFTRYLAEEDYLAANPARIAGVYYLRGVAHADNGDSGEALADFAISIRRWPHPPEVYEARASVYERLGIIDKARADREEAARRSKSIATEVQGRVSPIPH
jgi:tetratricopeptide (TPR) repeat protein